MEENQNQNGAIAGDNPNVPTIVKNELQTSSKRDNSDLIASVDFLNESDITKAEFFLKKLMRSDKGGIKSVEDGLAIMLRAKEMNIPFSTATEHVHVINGKTGVDIHVIKALLLKAGVTWDEPIMDYAPLYEYTDGFNVYIDGSFPDYAIRCRNANEAKELAEKDIDREHIYLYPVLFYKDFNGNIYKDYQLNANFVLVNNKQKLAKAVAEKKIPIVRSNNQPVDYITKYRLHRTIDGKEITAVGSFSYSEAVLAGFFEKDTYKKYARILIGHRAFTYAARDIASDIILGAYETTELKIITGSGIEDQDCVDITQN